MIKLSVTFKATVHRIGIFQSTSCHLKNIHSSKAVNHPHPLTYEQWFFLMVKLVDQQIMFTKKHHIYHIYLGPNLNYPTIDFINILWRRIQHSSTHWWGHAYSTVLILVRNTEGKQNFAPQDVFDISHWDKSHISLNIPMYF